MIEQFLFDSAFPNGGYSHSFGFESYISWGKIKDTLSFSLWLEAYMTQNFARNDGVVFTLANAFRDKKLSILKLARSSNSSITALESLNAYISMTKSTLNSSEFMQDDATKWYQDVVEKDERFAAPAVAFGLLCKNDLLESYAFATIKTLTINATRAVPLPYKKANELIYKSQSLAKISAEISRNLARNFIEKGYFSLNGSDKIFATNFELEMAMMGHESLDFRLFMS